MVLVCLLKSVVAFAEGTRRQRENDICVRTGVRHKYSHTEKMGQGSGKLFNYHKAGSYKVSLAFAKLLILCFSNHVAPSLCHLTCLDTDAVCLHFS